MSDNNPQVRFALEFTDQIYKYLEGTKKPTISQFANTLKVTCDTLHAWADKKVKNDKGELTDQYARPKFHEALQKLEDKQKAWQQKENENLNAKQELFCKLFATDREFFANGTQSYIEAYDINIEKKGAYNGARASASQLLTNTNILKRIDELLELDVLNDQTVDRELSFVIVQKVDFGAKVAAIREYNKLKARITDKIDHTTNGKELPSPIYGGKSSGA